MKEFMAKITRKLHEIFEYKQTRSGQEDGGFMLAITMNLLKNLAARNNIIHQELKRYKDERKKVDDNLQIATGLYVCSLVTCWETFFRDLFIFVCNHDDSIAQRLHTELDEEIPLGLSVGEYTARKYNFQNLAETHQAFDDIHLRKTTDLSEYFSEDAFKGVVFEKYALLFKWMHDGVFKEKVDTVLQKAFQIRHRVTHDANYRIKFDSQLLAEIECIFQMIPQFFTAKMAEKYGQERLVFHIKHQSIRITDNPTTDELPYALNVEDFMANDYIVIDSK